MQQYHGIKLPYYPQETVMQRSTKFGLLEITSPKIYEEPLCDKIILRVDLIDAVTPIVGENCAIGRKYLYKLLSGEFNSDTEFQQLCISMYTRFEEFRKYIDEQCLFANPEECTLTTAVMKPLLQRVFNCRDEVTYLIEQSGGKFLVETHGYIYACYRHKSLPELPVKSIQIGGLIC